MSLQLRFGVGAVTADSAVMSAGAFSGSGYTPLYTAPDGWQYNPATGILQRVSGWNLGYPIIANELLLTDQGSTAANQSLFQTTLTNAANDQLRLRLGPLSGGRSWGTGHTIPTRGRTGLGLVIEPAGVKDGSFPIGPNARVSPSTPGFAPFRATAANVPCLQFESGPQTVRIIGCDITWDPSFAATLDNVGSGTGTPGIFGFVTCFFGDQRADNVCLQGNYIHGATGKRTLRLTRLHGYNLGFLNNYFADAHDHTTDSQCVLIEQNTRDAVIRNNHFEGAYGEHLFVGGGGDTLTSARAVRNVAIVGNSFVWPSAYRTAGWLNKCFLESKGMEFALIQGNDFDGYFAGPASTLGNQYHAVTWKTSQWLLRNLTMRANRFRNCIGWFNLKNEGDNNAEGAGAGISRVEISHNAVYAPTLDYSAGYQFQILINDLANANLPAEFLKQWTLRRNTVRTGFSNGANASFFFDEIQQIAEDWNVTDNIIAAEPNGTPNTYYNRPAGSTNTAAVNYAARSKTGGSWTGNVVSNASAGAVIPGDTAVANVAALNLDAQLRAGAGPAFGKGADIDVMLAAISDGGGTP
jgi:hypothetical protein